MTAKKLTPMMQQFYDIKGQYPDCILFFRLGDFYEMFGDDAIVAAEILDITLTSRSKDAEALPMCGVPYHSAEGYIQKLTFSGKKVAICEQVSDPTEPGIVQREVIRVVTPGTNLSGGYLEQQDATLILALCHKGKEIGFSVADFTTGEWYVDRLRIDELADLLERIRPAEIVLPQNLYELPVVYQVLYQKQVHVSVREAGRLAECQEKLKGQLAVKSLAAFELTSEDGLLIQAGALLLTYLEATQKQEISHFRKIKRLHRDRYLTLDGTTIQNLELFLTQRDRQKQGSLFQVIDKTVTSAGRRLLAHWLAHPLQDLAAINQRLAIIETAVAQPAKLDSVRVVLKRTVDLQRLCGRLAMQQGSPKDLAAIRETLGLIPELKRLLSSLALSEIAKNIIFPEEIHKFLTEAVSENPPTSARDLGIVADSYNQEIDDLRKLYANSNSVLSEFLEKEKAATGITNLKIGSNKVIGFYLEVSKGKVSLVPDHYIAKQTLTNSNRYITPELKEYEEKVLSAESQLHNLEHKIYTEIALELLQSQDVLSEIASQLARLDCLLALAALAIEHKYIKPILGPAGSELQINAGRHPVVETLMPAGQFICNDTLLAADDEAVIVLTGPNMGGKSTYLRQTALITLLAHMGSYIPAESASIPLTDRIFTRVGASDNLAKGQSTFMVEMQELAVILQQATENSLLIIDEIGRGTSTFDGVSIAWATLEFIHNKLRSRCLFATHYHELIAVADDLARSANYSLAVHDKAGTITFLHSVQKGGVSDSYGIEVADLAGVPAEVVEMAKEKLLILEGEHLAQRVQAGLGNKSRARVDSEAQLALFGEMIPAAESVVAGNTADPNRESKAARAHKQLVSRINDIDINQLTPLEALQELAKLQEELD